MSLDWTLVDQVYRHDPTRMVWLFDHHDEPLLVMLANESRRVTYANEVARWAFGLASDLSLSAVHLEAVENGFLGGLIEQAMAGGHRTSALKTLKTAFAEEWVAVAAPVTFDGTPAAAIVIGRRSLRRCDRAYRTAPHASASHLTECLRRQVGLVYGHPTSGLPPDP